MRKQQQQNSCKQRCTNSCKPELKKQIPTEGAESRNYKVKEIFPQKNWDLTIQESEKYGLSIPILSRKQPEIEAIHNKINRNKQIEIKGPSMFLF